MIDAEIRGAWKELEQKLRPYVARRVVSAAETDDLLQEIFLKLHTGLSALEERESFGGWVYRVAHNAIVDHARFKQRDRLAPVETDVDGMGAATEDGSEELRAQLSECVAFFVGRLAAPYREVVTLTELHGLTQREVAERLGSSLPAVKSQVLRGRAKLRAMFEACCELSLDARGRVTECEARDRCATDCGPSWRS